MEVKMKIFYHCFLLFIIGIICIIISCVSPSSAPDTKFSVWYKVVSPSNLPDTIYYGQNISFQLAIGDSDGDPVSTELMGIPLNFYRITSNGDTSFIIINIVADSLKYDSLYTIIINTKAGSKIDSLQLTYSFFVADTTRLGGIRKLMVGTWWKETEGDTTITERDSASTTFITRDTVSHCKYNKVASVKSIDSGLEYTIESYDTSYSDTGKSLSKTLIRILHYPYKVEYIVPPLGGFTDSIRMRLYDLPLNLNKSWQYIKATGDTTVSIPLLIINVKLKVSYDILGNSSIPYLNTYKLNSENKQCFEIANITTLKTTMVCDSTITFFTFTIRKGDTITASTVNSNQNILVNTDFSVPLSSFTLEQTLDTNYTNGVLSRKTKRSGSWVIELFDARKNVVYKK
jgi:hypothetical protein